ncbi:hypothetical protein QEN19_004300 [Hanseniaspora menglaensis]
MESLDTQKYNDDNDLIKQEDLANISDLGSDTDLYTIDKEDGDEDEVIKKQKEDLSSSSSSDSSDSEYQNSDTSSNYSGDDINEDEDYDQDLLIKSKNEILNEPIKDISDIRDIFIDVKEQKNMKLGKIFKKINSMKKIIIESEISGNQYIIDTSKAILFTLNDKDESKVLGYISEIFGPVTHPYYTIAFEEKNVDIFNNLEIKDLVYVLIDDNFKLIKTSSIKLLKGSDASNFNDEEVDEKDIEFSDDEQEKEWKKQQKQKRSKKIKQTGNDILDPTAKLEKGYVSRGDRKGKGKNESGLITEESLKNMDVNKLKVILGPAVLAKEKSNEKVVNTPSMPIQQQQEQQPRFANPQNTISSSLNFADINMNHSYPHIHQQQIIPQQFQQYSSNQYSYQQPVYSGMPGMYQQPQYLYYGQTQQSYSQQIPTPQNFYPQNIIQPHQQQQPQQNPPIDFEQQQLLNQLNQLSPEQLQDILAKANQGNGSSLTNDSNVKIRKWNQK